MDGRGLPAAHAARIVIRPEDLQGAARLLDARGRSAGGGLPRGVLDAARRRRRAVGAGADGPRLAATTRGRPVLARGAGDRRRGHPDRTRRRRWRAGPAARCSPSRSSAVAGPSARCSSAGGARSTSIDESSRACLTLLAAQAALGHRARRPRRGARAPGGDRPADRRREPPRPGACARARPCRRPAHGRQLAVAVVDLDHFKAFNDTHGHPTGDLLLRNSVRAWREHLRAGDLLARYGGEEFVVVLPEAGDAASAVGAIERVRLADAGRDRVGRRGDLGRPRAGGAPHPPRRRRALRGQAQRPRLHGPRRAAQSRFSPQ